MLIDNPVAMIAACTAGAAALNFAILKFSPGIKDRLRHMLAGVGPVAGTLAALIGPNDSVAAYGTDLAALGAALVGGLAAAIGSTRYIRAKQLLPGG